MDDENEWVSSNAEHLLSQAEQVGTVGIEGGGGHVIAVVDGVHRRQGISRGKHLVEAGGAKIFANGLQRTAEDLRDAVEIRRARGSDGPQIQKRLHAGHGARPRCRIRNKCRGSLVQPLSQSFVVAEQESLARPNRSA